MLSSWEVLRIQGKVAEYALFFCKISRTWGKLGGGVSRSGNRRLEEGGELGMRGKSRQAERGQGCVNMFLS